MFSGAATDKFTLQKNKWSALENITSVVKKKPLQREALVCPA